MLSGFYMYSTVGIGIHNPGTVQKWHLTPEQSEALGRAADAAGLTVDAFVDQFETLSDLLVAVFGRP